EPEIGAERDEQAEQELVLEDPDAELGDERADGGERCPDLAADLAPVRAARLDRLVVAEVLRKLARLIGVDLGRELAHRLIVAAGSFEAGPAVPVLNQRTKRDKEEDTRRLSVWGGHYRELA